MRRILASLILITTFVIVAATARADSSTPSASLASSTPPASVPTSPSTSFSLLDPSTWKMPHYDWQSFKIQDPNSWPFIPGAGSRDRSQRRRHLRRAAGLAVHRRQERDQQHPCARYQLQQHARAGRKLSLPGISVVGHELVCGRRRAGDYRAQRRYRLPDRAPAQEMVLV